MITLLSNFKPEETMRTIRKNTKNVVKDKKGKKIAPRSAGNKAFDCRAYHHISLRFDMDRARLL